MEQIPQFSRDLIAMLNKQYKPRIVPVADLSTEQGRLRIANYQGRLELVQQLQRLYDKQEASDEE